MACRGVFYALSDVDLEPLLALKSDSARVEYLFEVIEEKLFGTQDCAETDKAWDGMHRALGNGTLDWTGGADVLGSFVLGGESLHSGDSYIFSLKRSSQVRTIADAATALDENAFRDRYMRIDPADYDDEIDTDDLEYTWSWYEGVKDLYSHASANDMNVLFTVDQ